MSDSLPTVADEKDDVIDAAADAFLRAERILEVINANLPEGKKPLVPVPKDYVFKKQDREIVSVMFHAVAHMIGGAPAMAAWAQQNPGQFYALYAKLLPSDTNTPVGNFAIQFVSPVPETRQDRVTIDDAGTVQDADFIPADEVLE